MFSSDPRNQHVRSDQAAGLGRATLLDVRRPDEFATGHLNGAVNVPVQELAGRLAELGPKDRPVAVYCRSGRRSGAAAQLLLEAGFASVSDLGGLSDASQVAEFATQIFYEPFPRGPALTDELPMQVRQLFDQDTFTFTYLLIDDATREAVMIDPVREQLERDIRLLSELGLTLKYALETHVHADHVTSAAALAERTGALTAASKLGAACAMRHLRDGDVVRFGDTTLRVLETPGHTQDSLSFYASGHVFTGDALFVRGTGRTDFQNGDAGALYDSITQKLFVLPEQTVVWPGHDYHGHAVSTIGEERRHNPRLAGKTREEFGAIMSELNLAPPKRIQVAVPANLACGRETPTTPAQG